ncbi:MAG: transposase [Dactylosporangium sp.]|nr:integrase core domain-containing protein [Dactylosporangium sp.]NNJ61384.1 transposase [Dactylosporangium sp.]
MPCSERTRNGNRTEHLLQIQGATTIGPYKAELINRRGPWRTMSDVELETAEWVDWYNSRRHHQSNCQCRALPCGHGPHRSHRAARIPGPGRPPRH